MNVPPVVQRHPALRWLAPIAVVGVAGLAATGMFSARVASKSLPATSPAALIAAVQSPKTTGFSGTLVSRLSLGLPDLPDVGGAGNGASMTSLLSGSHTLQIWYGGAEEQRIALLGATDETDVFRSGRELWQWSSADHTAVHTVLPTPRGTGSQPPTPIETLTPAGLARRTLDMLDPTTTVEIKRTESVADREAYELILTPRLTSTRVGSVHIFVDGATKLPLGVQVYARGQRTAAVDVSFSTISFAQPSATYFRFRPPAGATVREANLGDDLLGAPANPQPNAARPDRRLRTFGTAWTTVYAYRSGRQIIVRDGTLAKALTFVSGTWGSGRLIESNLLSVLITDDGRVYAGAVDPDALYAAAGSK